MKALNQLLASALVASACAAPSASAVAQTAAPAGAAASSAEMSEGEVRKIDKENKKITIRHGEIKNLGMPGMTMVFQVEDPSVLDSVQPGDKVRFHAEKTGGALVVTAIERAP